MNPRSTDRRTQRTRRALRDALLSLLVERGWDDLNVQDICARADVGRSTFYLHFPSKEDLLVGSLDDLRSLLAESASCHVTDKAAHPLSFVRGLLEHLYEQRQLCRSIFGRRSAHAVQVRFREMVGKLVSDSLAKVAPAGWQRDATARYLAGALVELLAWWIDGRPIGSLDDIEKLYQRLSKPAVRELMRA